MKYKAKLVEVKPADHGYYYPTYEYANTSGYVQRITGENAIIVNPWDWTKIHDIWITADGELKNPNNLKPLLGVLGIFVAVIMLAILAEQWVQQIFGAIFCLAGFIPVIGFGKSGRIARRRKRMRNQLDKTSGKIIWYHERVKRSNDHTYTYHYPIVEYQYMGQTMQTRLPESEDPIHEGEMRDFYIDMEHREIFTDACCKADSAIVSTIFTLFFTLPFIAVGLGLMLPESVLSDILAFVMALMENQNPSEIMEKYIRYVPLVFVGFFAVMLAKPIYNEIKTLCAILKAKRDGQHVYAAFQKVNDFGRHSARVYEYTYRGEVHKHQTEVTTRDESIELFIHPTTHKAYSKGDLIAQIVKMCILCFFLLFFGIAAVMSQFMMP